MHITEGMRAGEGVRSLRYTQEDNDHSVILVLPGIWDLGKTQRLEVISVLMGSLIINGQKLDKDEIHTIGLNCSVRFEASEPAVLYCTYGPIP